MKVKILDENDRFKCCQLGECFHIAKPKRGELLLIQGIK